MAQPSLVARRRASLVSGLGAALALAAVPVAPSCNCEVEPVEVIDCNFELSARGGGDVEFGEVVANDGSRSASVVVDNTGNRPLNAFDVEFTENGEHYRLEIDDDFVLDPGADETLLLVFEPTARSVLNTTLRMSHAPLGAQACPVRTLTLRGEGIDAPILDAGFEDAGFEDGGFFVDAGNVDGGFVSDPDGGILIGPDAIWSAYGGFEEARAGFATVELLDGSILAIGGYGENGRVLDTIERFDPVLGRSRIVATMAQGRAEPGAVMLGDGRVAIVGGRSARVGGVVNRTVEVFRPNDEVLECPGTQADGEGVCGDNALGFLPEGRIGPVVTSLGGVEIVVALGRELDDDVEVAKADGDVLNVGSGAVTPVAGLAAVSEEARVVDSDGSFVVIGGRDVDGVLSNQVQRFSAGSRLAGPTFVLPSSRALAGVTRLEDGSVFVVGGIGGAGVAIAEPLIIAAPFGDSSTIDPVAVSMTSRVSPSVTALEGDIVVVTGGLPAVARLEDLSVVPLTSADVVVPFGPSFARFSVDNDLAQGRVGGAAIVTGDDNDIITYLGGFAVSPRITPHPHAEEYRLGENAFFSFGLMAQGTAYVAAALPTSGAALVSLGGVDPHTGTTSARGRAFDAENGGFLDVSSLASPRRDHSATAIDVDLAVVIGGRDATGAVIGTASIINVSGVDVALPVSLRRPRAEHSATLLPAEAGFPRPTILICGGVGPGGEALDTCELFFAPTNPRQVGTFNSASFELVTTRMSFGRVGHSATVIDGGEVLLVGGGDVERDQGSADLFVPDVSTPRIRPSAVPVVARREHAAVHLGAGRVLVVGGEVFSGGLAASSQAELYVRATQTFQALPDMREARQKPAAFVLGDGNVLISGGTKALDQPGFPSISVIESELYVAGNTGVGTFEPIEIPLSYGRSDLIQVDVFGRAVVVGGTHRDGVVAGGAERQSPQVFVDMLEDP